MPFGLCNALVTFQHCMISIFSDIIEQCIEVFIDDFSVCDSSFDDYLANPTKVLQRYREKNFTLNGKNAIL